MEKGWVERHGWRYEVWSEPPEAELRVDAASRSSPASKKRNLFRFRGAASRLILRSLIG
jgi:hypothetical protein